MALAPLAARGAAGQTPRFGVFEVEFRARGAYRDPWREVEAMAAVRGPAGRAWEAPLFWRGGDRWMLRLSPDAEGEWSFAVRSNDAGLAGARGAFRCVASRLRGGIRPMRGYPLHFEHQNGEPLWLFGDTQWMLFSTRAEKKVDRASMLRYADVRAEQGFNYIHANLLGSGPAFAKGTLNTAYFDEVDERVRHVNGRGVTCGIVLAWAAKRGRVHPGTWDSFASDADRLRYAEYVAARYGAYNVTFLVSGEWAGRLPRKTYAAIGRELQRRDPHGRMIGIHPHQDGWEGDGQTSDGTVRDFAGEPWMAFGDYQQYYGPAPLRREASDADRDALHRALAASRAAGKPALNAEYAYYLRDRDGDGVVDKKHSHTRASFRRATWALAMTGGYVVAGFGTTYDGGNSDPGPFDVDAVRNDEAEADLMRVARFFRSLEWWKLSPADELVRGSPGYRYCLAQPGKRYVVYSAGAPATEIELPVGPVWKARRYDPRTGAFAAAEIPLRAPDAQDWVFLIERAGA